jgi:hypothetical protein
MPAPLAPDLRAAILAELRADGPHSCRGMAREHGVSTASIRKIAREAGIAGAFSRERTVKATRARTADNKAKRSQLQSDLLDDAQKIRKRAWSKCKIVVSGPEGVEVIELDLPPLADVRAAYTSIGIIVDKDAAIERSAATGAGTAEAESLMGRLAAALTEAVGGGTETMPDDS